MRVLILWVALLATACATSHRKSRPDLPESERGAAELRILVEDFDSAVARKDFEVAEEMAAELREGIKNADMLTITHWDYGRISELAQRAPKRLEGARRDAAIATLSKRIETQLDRANELLSTMASEAPTVSGLEGIELVAEELIDLREQGAPFVKDTRYAALVPRMKQATKRLANGLIEGRWRLELGEKLRQAMAVVSTTPADDLDARLAHAEATVSGLGKCQEHIEEARSLPGYAAELTLDTPLGRFSVDETAELCRSEQQDRSAQVAHLEWRRTVEAVARSVTDTLTGIEREEEPSAVMGASQRAIQAMEFCTATLAKTESDAGFDAAVRFPSTVGKKSAVDLRGACLKVGDNLKSKLPTLAWRITAAALREDIEQVRADTKGAKGKSRSSLEVLSAGYQRCVSSASELASAKGASPSKGEKKGMQRLARTCSQEKAYVDGLIKKQG